MVLKICLTCGRTFRVSPSHSYRKYCSRACCSKSEEWKANISEAQKSQKPRITKRCPICGKEFKVSPSKKNRTYCSRSCSNKSDEWKRNIGEGNRGKNPSLKTRKKMSKSHRKYYWTPDELYRLYWIEGKTLVEMGEELGAGDTTVLYWMLKYGIPRRNNLVAKNRKPNGLEVSLINIIEDAGLPYKYVGNGTQMVGERKPDFINTNGDKKVIELFGRHWHDPKVNPQIHSSRTMEKTINHYEKQGYSCLVIWEEELINEKQLLKKISGFTKK